MRIAAVLLLMILFVGGYLNYSHSQDATAIQKLNSIQGTVADKDWAGSTIVIRCFINNAADQMIFNVNDDTIFTKGAQSWSFSDLNVGDSVTINYSVRENQWPLAVSVNIAL